MSGFSLAGLLRLRRLEEDTRAAELSTARSREAVGSARVRRVRAQLAQSELAPDSFAALASIAAARAASGGMLVELERTQAEEAAAVATAETAHLEAHRRTRALEKLQERHDAQQLADELRREQRTLDEIAARGGAR